MMIFAMLTLMMAGVILLSASLFYLGESLNRRQTAPSVNPEWLVFDDVERSRERDGRDSADAAARGEIEPIGHRPANALPLLGMPDKAYYHIH
ncbi:MAG: hypothetical protein KatS3mg121_1173 [Gammaproteobacteria bacterium]|nr:MAG: hypothetical protein KatS3mg121_1173 [Gammaproteobacteria bacterium]